MYRISKGDITIEASTDAELAHAVKVLTDQNVPIPSTFGSPAQMDKYARVIPANLAATYRRAKGLTADAPTGEYLIKHPDDPGVSDVS
jgi:hypothetical protein